MSPIAVTKRYCPYCDTVHDVEIVRGIQRGVVKGEYLRFLGTYLRCPERQRYWADEDMSRRNMASMRIAYREQCGSSVSEQT